MGRPLADKDSEHFMKRFFCLGFLIGVLALGTGAVAQQQIAATDPVPAPTRVATRVRAYSTTIQGNALTSTNGQLANTLVRLRDARYGRVVETQMTDKSGLFAFHDVEPGSYIVEIVSSDQSAVLAASEILNVDAGDVASAVVKLPFRLPPFGGVGGNAGVTTSGSAAAVITQAAIDGVLIIATPPTAVTTCPQQAF